MKQSIRFEAIIDSDIEKINPLFSKVKIRIAYTGANRNGSYISKETFEKALPTIYNCPIIGEYIEEANDFGSHGGKIEISDKGIKYIQTTKPFGIINETSEISWEDVIEENGVINTYLCATGYLWTGRYDELFSLIDNSKSQSMEIEVNDGKSEKINGKDVYVINDFIFSAFCILGDTTEPCFESANVSAFSLNKEEFKLQFSEMLTELKQSLNQSSFEVDNTLNNKEGGNDNLDEKLELLAKYNLTIEQLDFTIEELSLEELEIKLKEFAINEDTSKETEELSFSATYKQKREALRNALDPKIEKDVNGNVTYEEYFYVEDFDDTHVFVEKNIWTPEYECTYGRYTYTFDESTLTATLTSEFEEMVLTWLTLEENQKIQDERNELTQNFEKLQKEFAEYKEKFSTSNEEVVRLQEFENKILTEQRETDESAIFATYDEKLAGDESYEAIKVKASEYSLEDLEKEIALLFARKSTSFSLTKNKKQTTQIKFSVNDNETHDELSDVYGGLIKKVK